MQDYELDAWLGPAVDDVTDEQRAAIKTAADRVDARWPENDLSDLREAAFNAAVQVVLGDTTLAETGAAYTKARIAEQEAHAVLTGALIAQAELAPATAEQALAEVAGVTRMTVRKALGKR